MQGKESRSDDLALPSIPVCTGLRLGPKTLDIGIGIGKVSQNVCSQRARAMS